jgi:hypothetical protein
MSSLLESLGLRHEVILVVIAAGIFWFVVYEWTRKSKAGMFSKPIDDLD